MYKTNSRTQVQAANFVYVLRDVQCTRTGTPRGRHRDATGAYTVHPCVHAMYVPMYTACTRSCT